MKTLSVVATLATCFLLCSFRQEAPSSQRKPGPKVGPAHEQKTDAGKGPRDGASPRQPAIDATDKNSVAPTAPHQNDKVEVTALPPEIAVRPLKDSIDRTILTCTIVLTIVGILGTLVALRTLRAIKRQAEIMQDHASRLEELAEAAKANAEAANKNAEFSKLNAEATKESAEAAKASAGAAQRNIELIINKERARLRICKPEKLVLTVDSLVGITFKLAFAGLTPAFSVSSEVNAVISGSKESPEKFIPHGITDLPTVVSATDIKPSYSAYIMSPVTIDESTLQQIKQQERFVHFWGIIKYVDFCDRPRETTFRYRWRATDTTLKPRGILDEWWEEVGNLEDNRQT